MTSLGFGKKVDRIERDPHVALAFQAEVAAARWRRAAAARQRQSTRSQGDYRF